jgi:hypothetical protein
VSRLAVAFVLAACRGASEREAPPPMTSPVDAVADSVAAIPIDAPPPWGAPVVDPHAERAAVELFAAIASGKARPEAVLAPVFAVGPMLWGQLLHLDSGFASIGTPSSAVLPTGRAVQQLEMRTFREAKDRAALIANPAFQLMAKVMAAGTPRAADAAERQLLYALVPFEISGRPVTMLVTPKLSLLVYIENGMLVWADAPQFYPR